MLVSQKRFGQWCTWRCHRRESKLGACVSPLISGKLHFSSSGSLHVSGSRSSSNSATTLHQASWMRQHPVEKLSVLGRIAAAGPHLLDESTEAPHRSSGGATDRRKKLWTGMMDVGHSSALVEEAGGKALWCPATTQLSYAGRLQIALSLLLWVRGLRDVQDTIARLHLPYAPTHRVTRGATAGALVAFPFPTRRVERWVDPFTSVQLRLHPGLNPTGEQVPAPHTWDPENSVSFDDMDLEESMTAEISPLHGDKGSRENRAQRLQRVQGLSRLPSSLDEVPSRRAKQQAAGLQLRRRRRGIGQLQQRPGGLGDAARAMPPVPFQSEEDTRYHGNLLRGECCPLNEEGVASPMPICVNLSDDLSRHDEAAIVAGCIKAHVAILSSLFIEGRTVAFTTNHAVVLSYVQHVFAELIDSYAAVSAQLSRVTPSSIERESSSSLPYIPLWSTREVLVLLPPLKAAGFSDSEVDVLAGTILQATFQGDSSSTPLTIVVEADASSSYLSPLQQRAKEKLIAAGLSVEKVQWMPLPHSSSDSQNSTGCTSTTVTRKRIQRFTEGVSTYSEHLYAVQLLHTSTNSLLQDVEIDHLIWHQLSVNTRLVGVNTSVWHTLFYYPQVAFLQHKIGNAFRYRAVERSLVCRRSNPALLTDPIAWAFGRRRGVGWLPALHSGLPLLPCKYYATSNISTNDPVSSSRLPPTKARASIEKNMNPCFLLCERIIDYLANPTAVSLVALFSARLLGL